MIDLRTRLIEPILASPLLSQRLWEYCRIGGMLHMKSICHMLEAYDYLHTTFNDTHPTTVYYAMKADGDPRVVKSLLARGANVEVNSQGELKVVVKASRGLEPNLERIIFSNPHRSDYDITQARANGVTLFVSQSWEDLQAIADNAPGSAVFIRIVAKNSNGKGASMNDRTYSGTSRYGVSVQEAIEMILRIRANGINLIPYGLVGHIGSGEKRPDAWMELINDMATALQLLQNHGIKLRAVDLGGGFPSQHDPKINRHSEYADTITQQLQQALTDFKINYLPQLIIEPGTGIAANGVMFGQVLGCEKRVNETYVTSELGKFAGILGDDDPIIHVFRFDKSSGQLREVNGKRCKAVMYRPITAGIDRWDNKHSIASDVRRGDILAVAGLSYRKSAGTQWCLREKTAEMNIGPKTDVTKVLEKFFDRKAARLAAR